MNHIELMHKLTVLPNKRAFARRAGIADRTVWRIIAGHDNITQDTKRRIESALRSERKSKA